MPIMEYQDDDDGDFASLFASATDVQEEQNVVATFPSIMWDVEFARLSIESVGLSDVSVFNGDAEAQLSKGVGHFTGSRFPGQGGNVVFLAHRNKEFSVFKYIELGDLVEVETSYGVYVYRVTETHILNPDDYSLIYPDDRDERLTMYTCYPFNYIGNAPQRFYVVCELVSGGLWDRETGTFIPYEAELPEVSPSDAETVTTSTDAEGEAAQ